MNMNTNIAGYQEIEHTADWEIRVWAPDISTLFKQAAQGMYSLAGVVLESKPLISRRIEIQNIDLEGLLVDFLSELLYISEVDNVAFNTFNIHIKGEYLFADLKGAPLASLTKEIKAVTYHNLEINKEASHFEVSIVFDV
jgi:SHS2 domain-containing protein